MLRKYDVIQCPDIEKFEKDKKYTYHMSRVFHTKCSIDTSQPELSPRHRMIAQKAEARRKEYLRRSRAHTSHNTSMKGFPHTSKSSILTTTSGTSTQSPRASKTANLTTTSKSIVDTPLFRSPARYVEPAELDFLDDFVPFRPTQTRHEKAMDTSRSLMQQLSSRNYSTDKFDFGTNNLAGSDEIHSSSDDLVDDLSSPSESDY